MFGCLIISNMKSLPAGFAALVGSDVTVFGATLWLLKFRAEWNGKERLFFFLFPAFFTNGKVAVRFPIRFTSNMF